MFTALNIKRLSTQEEFDSYSQFYKNSSGFIIPNVYIQNSDNRVYGLFYKEEFLGGFILGVGKSLRTLEVFAHDAKRYHLYKAIGNTLDFTEITCFWIQSKYRRNTLLNTFTWLSLAFLLKRYSRKNILFGTCSTSLAKLYGVTPKSKLIHQDFINGKNTYIFQSKRKTCLQGFLEILRYKFSRTAKIKQKRKRKRTMKIAS